jgi:hypothetical protein
MKTSTWLSADNAKWLLGTLAIPATLALLNQQYQDAQTERQATEARLRLYTELLSRREEADTNLRKGIFDKVLEKFLKEGKTVSERIVALELLAANFNESLDLSPLFWEVFRELQQPANQKDAERLLRRLKRVANDVKARQIALLTTSGEAKEQNFDLRSLKVEPGQAIETENPIDSSFTLTDPDVAEPDLQKRVRHFRVYPVEHDAAEHRVFVSVEHEGDDGKREVSFWVDEFDFPLSNYSRISKSERFALVMETYNPPQVALTLVYFPSSRGGLKDKPYIDEVISGLKRESGK